MTSPTCDRHCGRRREDGAQLTRVACDDEVFRPRPEQRSQRQRLRHLGRLVQDDDVKALRMSERAWYGWSA